jgi:hypothetical protein
MGLTHSKVSVKPDTADTSIVQPSDWNAAHQLSAAGLAYAQTASGSIASVSAGQNYHKLLRRKFNASSNEEYEFVAFPEVVSSDYNFTAQAPAVALTSGITNTITLTPVPLGVNGSNTSHYLYIADGVGGNEIVLITGGTAISGAASGTITFVPASNHVSGNWSIRSATVGIQEAVYVLGSSGGLIRIPTGQFTFYGPITIPYSNTKIRGNGFYATWLQTSYIGGHLINFTNSVTLCGGNSLEYLTLVGPNNGAATNYGVYINNNVRFWARYVNISQVANGFLIADNGDSDSITFDNCCVSYFVSVGFDVQGSNSQIFIQCSALAGGANSTGFKIVKTGGLNLSRCLGFQVAYGLDFAPGAGQSASLAWVDSCTFDACTKVPTRLMPRATTGVIHSVTFVNTYSTFSTENGMYISTNEFGGEIEEITIQSHRVLLNQLAGIVVRGTKIKNILINGSTITSNSAAVSEASDGIYIEPAADGPDGVIITNNIIGVSSYHTHKLRCGINFGYGGAPAGATNNVVCTGNRINDSVTSVGGVLLHIAGLDVITGKNVVAKDNVPDANTVLAAVQVGAALLLGGSTCEMYTVTGTSAVNDITPALKGARKLITKTDAGSLVFNTSGTFRNAVTLTQGLSLVAIYDGTKWNLMA